MTDDRYHVEIDLPDVLDFQVGETFDLSQRIIEFTKKNQDVATKELMIEILDHINSLYRMQGMMMKEYNNMLSEWASLLEGLNGNGGTDPGKV